MKSFIPLVLLLACGTADLETPEEIAKREQEAADQQAIRDILSRLEAQTADLTVSTAGRGVVPGEATPMTNAEHLKEIYDLLLYLENRVLDLENEGIMRAQDVSYDPRATKVSSKKVQGALDEIEIRLQDIEDKIENTAGSAGPGLYSLNGGGGGGPPRGGNETQGKNDGPADIPAGGGGGGGMGPRGGQGGGGQGDGGQGGGGQGGGGQDGGGGQGGGGQDGGGGQGGGMRGNTGQ